MPSTCCADAVTLTGVVLAVQCPSWACYLKLAVTVDEDALLMGAGTAPRAFCASPPRHHYILLKCERAKDHVPVQVGDCVQVEGAHAIAEGPFVLAREADMKLIAPGEELGGVPRVLWERVWEGVEDDNLCLHYAGCVVRQLGPFTYQLDNSLRLHTRLDHFPIGLPLTFYNLVCTTAARSLAADEGGGGGEESLVYCPHFSSHRHPSGVQLEKNAPSQTDIGGGAVVDFVRLAGCQTALQAQLRGIISSSYLSAGCGNDKGKFVKFARRVMQAGRDQRSLEQEVSDFEQNFSDHARHGRCSACVQSSFPFPLLSLATTIQEQHHDHSVRPLGGSVLATVQFCPLSGRLMVADATGSSFVLRAGQEAGDGQVAEIEPNSLVLCRGLRLVTERMPDALPPPRYLVVEDMRVVSSLRSGKQSGLAAPLAMAVADPRGGPPLSLFIIKYLHPPTLLSSRGPMMVTVEGYTFGRLVLCPAGGSKVEMIQQTASSFQLSAAASALANLQVGEVLVVMAQPADAPVQFCRLEYECDPQISTSKQIRLLGTGSGSGGGWLRMACSVEAFNYLSQSQKLLRESVASGGTAASLLRSHACQVIPQMDMCVISREFQDSSELGLARVALRLSTRLFRECFIGLPTRKHLVLYCRAESVMALVIPPNSQLLYPLGLLPGARVRASGLAILPGTNASLPPLLAPTPHSTLQVLALGAGPGLDKYPLRYLCELARQTATAFVCIIGQLVAPDEVGMRRDCLPPGEDRFRCQRCGLPIRQAECPSHGPLPVSEWRPLRGLTLPFLDMTAAGQVHIDPEMQIRLLRADLLQYHRSGDALGPRPGVDLRLYCRFVPGRVGGGRLWLEDYALVNYAEQCCQLLEVLESPLP